MSEWIDYRVKKPDAEGKYLTFGSFGIGTSWWHSTPFRYMFQDCDTNCDEGMTDWNEEPFYVTHWQPLPEKPQPPEDV